MKNQMNRWKTGGIIVVLLVIGAAAATGKDAGIVLAGCLILAVAVCWVVFPLIVLSKFNDLLKVNREIMNAQREIARALQGMVNNWGEIKEETLPLPLKPD